MGTVRSVQQSVLPPWVVLWTLQRIPMVFLYIMQ